MDRDVRKLLNSKQDLLFTSNKASVGKMIDGQISISRAMSKYLALVLKSGGKLWKTYLSSDGDFQVDRNLYASGNIFINGTVFGNQIYYYPHNFNFATNTKAYLEFNQSGVTGTFNPFNSMIAPYNGRLVKVLVRSESVAGSTVVGIHKATNGTTDPDSTAFETSTVNMSSIDTTYEFIFTANAFFNKGDLLALSIDPSNAPQNTSIVSVWSYNITKD
tara:strand:- start:1321 stop:1974 length:654 start_codon:yes stop_codon:yes gene_type:complete